MGYFVTRTVVRVKINFYPLAGLGWTLAGQGVSSPHQEKNMTFKKWAAGLLPYWATFLTLQLSTRVFLLFYSDAFHDVTPLELLQIFACGFCFDLLATGFFLAAMAFFHLFLHAAPGGKAYARLRFISFFILTYVWLFTAVAEFFFWEEFGTRFNFIAVDYLVYTQEVLGNIYESYPLIPVLLALGVIALLVTWGWRKALAQRPETAGTRSFRMAGIVLILAPFILISGPVDTLNLAMNNNQSLQELAKNGTYSLFSAYRNNELDFKGFYKAEPKETVARNMRKLLDEDENKFLNNDPEDITRVIRRAGPELHKNVIMVVMESMSAEYMGSFGNKRNLTPELDRLGREGLSFTHLYATGTRTVRGLEALSLSIPPTPGQSIIRRPNNGNLFTLGSVFQDRGYDTAFIYGGHGYFDNMNAYYEANGFRIVDRMSFSDNDVRFSNVWGVCDEDLFNQVLTQADRAQADGKPFFYTVMTTSNHRPYTFPEGAINMPQKNRLSAVRYADHAVGQLVKNAEKKKWFKDTVFVFVADHTAGAGGKAALSLDRYHIPAILYAPGFIKPQRYELTASQIDLPPTLLGLLNFSYRTKFFGEDVLNDNDEAENAHTFISNYQKIALLRNGSLFVLEPRRMTTEYKNDKLVSEKDEDPRLLLDTVSYYQYAADWRTRMKRISSIVNPHIN